MDAAKELLCLVEDKRWTLRDVRHWWEGKHPDTPIPHRLQEDYIDAHEEVAKKGGGIVRMYSFCPLHEHSVPFPPSQYGHADTTDVLVAVQKYLDERTEGRLQISNVVRQCRIILCTFVMTVLLCVVYANDWAC